MGSISMPITVLAVLGAVVGYNKSSETTHNKPNITIDEMVPQTLQSKWPTTHWQLSNQHSKQTCQIQKETAEANSPLQLSKACQHILSGAEFITTWYENDDGTIGLGDQEGNMISEFSYSVEAGLTSISGEPGALRLEPTL